MVGILAHTAQSTVPRSLFPTQLRGQEHQGGWNGSQEQWGSASWGQLHPGPQELPGRGNLKQSIASEDSLPGVWRRIYPWGQKTEKKKRQIDAGFENRQVPTLERFCRYVKQNLKQPSSFSELLLCFLYIRRLECIYCHSFHLCQACYTGEPMELKCWEKRTWINNLAFRSIFKCCFTELKGVKS